jgi:tetratricopeptide (TPR) repeat protein
LEFLIKTNTCTRCTRPTQPCKERINELTILIEEFKEKRRIKKEKLEKYKLIRQTEKTTKNMRFTKDEYNKWDYFTDEEDSAEELLKQNPSIPENDPQFKAMETDMRKRQARKEQEHKQGLQKKQEGNTYFKKGKLEFAEMKYSEGIEIDKCNKNLWLNRALVRMKLMKWPEAAEDCTRMIEYMEWIEEGFEKSIGCAVKAFLRRAKSYWKMGEFVKALEDVGKLEEVLKGKEGKEKEVMELVELKEKIVRDRDVKGSVVREDKVVEIGKGIRGLG